MPDSTPRRRLALRRPLPACLVLAGVVAWGTPARAKPVPGVTLSEGQLLLVPGSPALGFFTVTNTTDTALLVTRWSTPACGMLQLEEAGASSGGVARLTIPARGQLAFAPGGYHLTCWQPTPALQAGATVPVSVAFQTGLTVTAPFEIRLRTPPGAR